MGDAPGFEAATAGVPRPPLRRRHAPDGKGASAGGARAGGRGRGWVPDATVASPSSPCEGRRPARDARRRGRPRTPWGPDASRRVGEEGLVLRRPLAPNAVGRVLPGPSWRSAAGAKGWGTAARDARRGCGVRPARAPGGRRTRPEGVGPQAVAVGGRLGRVRERLVGVAPGHT